MRIVYFIILFTFVCNYAKNQGLSNSIKISDVANDLTVTTAGKVLDARQGKILNEKIQHVRIDFKQNIIDQLGNTSYYESADGLIKKSVYIFYQQIIHLQM
jgi:hypothetical protein